MKVQTAFHAWLTEFAVLNTKIAEGIPVIEAAIETGTVPPDVHLQFRRLIGLQENMTKAGTDLQQAATIYEAAVIEVTEMQSDLIATLNQPSLE